MSPEAASPEGAAKGDGRSAPLRIGAIDLGTNKCRWIIAEQRDRALRVLERGMRVIRLGEGLVTHGRLGDAAMERGLEVLHACARRFARLHVIRHRCVATAAVRRAVNGRAFLARIAAETGLEFEVPSPEEEARLALRACRPLLGEDAANRLLLDIGGGSTELVRLVEPGSPWIHSLPTGVVTLAEKAGRRGAAAMRAEVRELLGGLTIPPPGDRSRARILAISDALAALAAVGLDRGIGGEERFAGIELPFALIAKAARMLASQNPAGQRADIAAAELPLVLAAAAILAEVAQLWPASRLVLADRGLHDGILLELAEGMAEGRDADAGGHRP